MKIKFILVLLIYVFSLPLYAENSESEAKCERFSELTYSIVMDYIKGNVSLLEAAKSLDDVYESFGYDSYSETEFMILLDKFKDFSNVVNKEVFYSLLKILIQDDCI